MKENKLLKILLISVVFGLGACSSTNASISSTSNDLMNSTSSAINKDTVKKYTVKWVVDDKVFEETYKEGETPTYKFGTSKEADNTYTYTFSGWDKLIKPVTENVTYTAQYIKEYIDYTYTWVIGEEEVTETYHYGDEVSYKGEEPTKEGTDQYSYVFTGWGKELGTVTGDEVLEAQFEKVLNTYEVTFDVEGVKTTETYYYGQIPEYNQTPAKESTDNNYYEFSGWDKTFEPVTEDVTYTAVFTEFEYKYYDVNFFDFDGELLFTQNLKEGSIPTYTGDVPVIKDGNNNEYTFSGWLNRDTKIGYQNDLPKLTTNINYYAYSEDYYLTNTDYSVIEFNYYNLSNELVNVENKLVNKNETFEYNSSSKEGFVTSHEYIKDSVEDTTASYNIYYSELDVWNKDNVSESLVGSGTESNPYIISSAADLAYLKAQVESGTTYEGSYFKMTKSLDLNDNHFMIGNFGGHFDGNNCSIRGLNINNGSANTGLFSVLTNGEVKNLSTYGSIKGVGVIGSIVGLSSGVINNCTNYAVVTGNGQRGGIVGSTTADVINCVNYGDVKVNASGWNVGGIVGESSANVSGCINNGNVFGKTTFVAGIVSTTTGIIDNCVNNGNVSGGTWGSGGITASSSNKVLNCVNNGDISVSDKKVGGISGIATGEVSNCINNGNINSTGTSDVSSVGGIVGHNENKAVLNIISCTNYGSVTSKAGKIGGIIGVFYKGEIKECTNYGDVTGTNHTAGIAGQLAWSSGGTTGTIKVTDCINNGDIYGSAYFSAGICGSADFSIISGCINNGDIISSSDCCGGIASAIYAASKIINCTNNGLVKGKTNLAGLVYENKGTIENSINTGNLELTTATGTVAQDYLVHSNTGTITNCTNTGTVIKP